MSVEGVTLKGVEMGQSDVLCTSHIRHEPPNPNLSLFQGYILYQDLMQEVTS